MFMLLVGPSFLILTAKDSEIGHRCHEGGLSGDWFRFDGNGDGPARYNIIHFKQVSPGKYRWIRVGEYLEGTLNLNMSVYAALLTKTNRISRIFNAGKHSAKRPSFISPRSQLIICTGLVFIQMLINGVWILLSPARAIHHYPTREDNLLVCSSLASTNGEITITTSHGPTSSQHPMKASPPQNLSPTCNDNSTSDLLVDSPNQPTINQTCSNVVDGINLDEIKEFAKAFKLRRL
ncbi:mangetout [Carabus blaptoides fortunei]